MALQFLSPFNFSGKPQIALAGANTQTWSTYNDFNTGTTQSQVTINDSSNPTDENLGNVKLADAFGTGIDCDVTIGDGSTATTVYIKDLYELGTNAALTRVTLANCANPAKNGSGKGLNYGASSYLASASAVPNFHNLTITANATLTTTGPSGANPGVKIKFLVKNSLTVDGSINASGKGYGGGPGGDTIGYGPGAGTSAGYYLSGGGSGGGYGGAGGYGRIYGGTIAGGVAYTYQTSPFGSGGGAGYSGSSYLAGGAGGGAIDFSASLLTVNGNILADGANGGGAGGSGGSVHIISSSGINSSKLSAKGGTGNTCYWWNYTYNGSGGGGGGRVILEIPAGLITGSPLL
ncbi:hypothetical protein COX25_00030, partial [bacterium (Candidatus Howlettbacteria) CG23_combo_of_CG06-09_8_20_14_all_37_9]